MFSASKSCVAPTRIEWPLTCLTCFAGIPTRAATRLSMSETLSSCSRPPTLPRPDQREVQTAGVNRRRRNRGSDSTRYASQHLTKQGPRRHNRSISSSEAVGLDVRQIKYRLKRMLGLGRCLEVSQRI